MTWSKMHITAESDWKRLNLLRRSTQQVGKVKQLKPPPQETEATNKTRKLLTMDGELQSTLELDTQKKKGGYEDH